MDRGIDRALRVVVAAARSGSLSAAGRDLGMTQAAVSQAVKRAEAALGFELLARSRLGVAPTAPAAELLERLASAYDSIDDAVALVRTGIDEPHVAITVSTSFATWWLLPRLPEFKRDHPEITLRIATTDTDAGVDLADVDLWIPLGLIDAPGLDRVQLCDEVLVPVAAPALASRHADWTAAELLQAPLLHLEERYEPRFDWARWFAIHDAPGPVPGLSADTDRTTDYSLVLHSALGGQGVALGWRHLVSDLVDDGRLIPLAAPVKTDRPFEILRSAKRPIRPDVDAFRSWLVTTMQRQTG